MRQPVTADMLNDASRGWRVPLPGLNTVVIFHRGVLSCCRINKVTAKFNISLFVSGEDLGGTARVEYSTLGHGFKSLTENVYFGKVPRQEQNQAL